MFTLRRQAAPAPLLPEKPREAPPDVLAFIHRMRTLAAEGDVELAALLEDLAPYLPTDVSPPAT